MSGGEELSVSDLAGVSNLIEQHRGRLLQMIRRRIDPALAVRIEPEEILQDAFVSACRRWVGYCACPSVSPYAWLDRIVLDTLIEVWRRELWAIRDLRRDLPWPAGSSVQLAVNSTDLPRPNTWDALTPDPRAFRPKPRCVSTSAPQTIHAAACGSSAGSKHRIV